MEETVMANPWDEYKTPVEAGPWSEFEQPIAIQEDTQQERQIEVPQWGRENPNLYGVAGAARETLGPLVEAGGLVGGALLGTPAGPAGNVAGAGLGYGAAKELTGMADVALGIKEQQALPEQLKQAGSNVAEGMMLEAGGQAVVPALKLGAEAVGKGVSTLVGDLGSGQGAETLRQLSKTGEEGGAALASALRNMRDEGANADSIVVSAKHGLRSMKERMGKDYNAAMKSIEGADKPLDFKLVTDSYDDIVKTFQHKGTWKVGKQTQSKIEDIGETIREWQGKPELHNTMGFDALKQRVWDLMPKTTEAGKGSFAVKKVYNSIKDAIVKENPKYADVMKNFEGSIKQIEGIEKELSLGDKASVGTALRKLQSVTRNNAQTNYGNRVGMVKALEAGGGKNILSDIAGQASSAMAPRGLNRIMAQGAAIGGGVFNPALLSTLPFMMPRAMGEAAVKIGQMKGGLKWAANKLGMNQESVKQLLQGSYVGEDNAQRQEQLVNLIRSK